MLIKSLAELEAVCARLREAGSFGLDTEFVQERNYSPRLGIVQVAGGGVEAIIDPGAVGSLDPLVALLVDPAVEKIVHSGQGDFGIFYWRSGKAPAAVFDTQVAAALVGYGDKISFLRLVEAVTGTRLAKSETLTDWTRRPLTPEQIDYALDDVRPLATLRSHLGGKLKDLGREVWAREEFRVLEQASTYERPDPQEAYLRIRAANLDGRALAVLRELAAWREEEAQARDVPRGFLAKDDVLVELARRPPTKPGMLRNVRFLDSRTVDACGGDIVAAAKRGLDSPPLEPPASGPAREEAPGTASLVSLLEGWMRARALEAQISPGMLGNRAHLEAIAAARTAPEPADVPLLQGWRRTLVGEDLLALLAGKMRLSVDPATGTIRAERT